MKLHLKQLTDKGARQEQVNLFRTLFGDSVDVTEELCASVTGKFDFYWAASNLLTPSARAEYERVAAPAWAEYERIMAAGEAGFKRIMAARKAEYIRATAAVWAEQERARAAVWAEHERARVSAGAEYVRATAVAFANAYNSQVQE
jgi:hypothetical protein